MTSKERIGCILARRPVDRVGLHESIWGQTLVKWRAEGHLREDEDPTDHFGFDFAGCGWLNMVVDLDFEDEVLEETDEHKLVRSGNGAVLRWWKEKAGTPEHVDFLVKNRKTWEEFARPHLTNADNYRRRIDVESYRNAREAAEKKGLYFTWGGVNVFECMHPLCGHEHMLVGMALDPDWVRDMCNVYADLILNLLEITFSEGGDPDALFFYEDMGFKNKPFMSPAMYKDIVWPAHKRTFDFAHARGLPVIVHSCGGIMDLVPGLIEAGMDCLQAMEVKAGMDLVELKKKYGDRIAFFGGLDIRALETNDKAAVEAELQKKLPVAMEGSGYILHSDHSIPDTVEYETYKFFVERGLDIGTYR